jgi:hypothetical protein
MTGEELKIYKIGLEKVKSDEVFRLNSKFVRLKNDAISSLNDPFDEEEFKIIAGELIEVAKNLNEAKQELDKVRKEI